MHQFLDVLIISLVNIQHHFPSVSVPSSFQFSWQWQNAISSIIQALLYTIFQHFWNARELLASSYCCSKLSSLLCSFLSSLSFFYLHKENKSLESWYASLGIFEHLSIKSKQLLSILQQSFSVLIMLVKTDKCFQASFCNIPHLFNLSWLNRAIRWYF